MQKIQFFELFIILSCNLAKYIKETIAISGLQVTVMISNITEATKNMKKIRNHSSQVFNHLNHSGDTQL
jgi:hypothetical protein